MNKDIIKYAIVSVLGRKTRSYLTILSILVGIAAIFTLVSFGQGISSYVTEMSQKQGVDKLMVMPKTFTAPPDATNIIFTKDDLSYIKKISGVQEATPAVIRNAKIKFKDYKEKYTYVAGTSTDGNEKRLAEETFTLEIDKGRGLKSGDIKKAVLGHNYLISNKIFKKAINIGDKITINDVPVDVVGFYKEVGNPQDDAQVYISLEGAKEIFGDEDYQYILIRSAQGQDPAQLADKIKEKFRKHKNQPEGQEDFTIQTFQQAIETFTSIIGVINAILFIIALISVIVASVNTMNTMYTSVLERTSEIGIMKSVGAKNSFILTIFVTESGLLGFLAGAIGVLLGFILSKIGGAIAAGFGLALLKPAFPLWLVLGCLLFATVVGALSGLLPSIQASKLNPVDALREE